MHLMSKRKWPYIKPTNGLPQRSIDGISGDSKLRKTGSSRNRASKADLEMMPNFTVPELALFHIKVHEDDKSENIKQGT